MIVLVPVLILFLFLLPTPVLAWGPGVHMAIGNQFLMSLQVLPPWLSALLAVQPHAFLYGCLSADIFVGKGCSAKPGHSHNWETAQTLLLSADSPPLRAHALGYVSHLAADVIAHNYYVPTMLGLTPGSGKLSHVLVEMQADRRVHWSSSQASGVLLHPHWEQDLSLLMATKRKRWPFEFKKRLYTGSVRISGSRELRKTLSNLRRMFPLTPEMQQGFTAEPGVENHDFLMHMLDLSFSLSFQAVTAPETSLALEFDPIGGDNLREVKRLRRKGLHLSALGVPMPPGKLFPLDPRLLELADFPY